MRDGRSAWRGMAAVMAALLLSGPAAADPWGSGLLTREAALQKIVDGLEIDKPAAGAQLDATRAGLAARLRQSAVLQHERR